MNSNSSSRIADTWAERLGRFQAADMSVGQFCEAEGVSPAAYYYWRRKLRGPARSANQDARPISVATPQPAFLPVALASPADASTADSSAAMTIELPGGIRVRLEVPMQDPGDHA